MEPNKKNSVSFILLLLSLSFLFGGFQIPSIPDRSTVTNQFEIDTTQAMVFLEEAYLFEDSVQYDSALTYYQKAIDLYEPYMKKETALSIWRMFVNCLNRKSNCYKLKNAFNKSLEWNNKALDYAKKMFGNEDELVAKIYEGLGATYIDIGQQDKALDLIHKSLSIRLKTLGPDHPRLSGTYLNLGSLYYYQGKYPEALGNYDRALRIDLKEYGSSHAYVAEDYKGIGIVYRKLGAYQKALEYYEKALLIDQKTSDGHSPEVADDYNKIGNVHLNLNEFEKALEYFKKALNISTQLFGTDHSYVASNISSIGAVYIDLGQLEKALSYFQKTLEINKRLYGEVHQTIIGNYEQLGIIYSRLNQNEKALEYLQHALRLQEGMNPDHPYIATILNNIGTIYSHLENEETALEYYQKALAKNLETYGKNHFSVGACETNISLAWRILGDYHKGLLHAQKGLAIHLNVYGENHTSVAISYNNIAAAYSELGEQEKALSFYKNALKILLKIFGGKHEDVAIVYHSIGDIYQKLGKYDEALIYHQKSLMANVINFNSDNIASSPSISDTILSIPIAVRSLSLKADALKDKYLNQSHKLTDLQLSQQNYYLATQFVAKNRQASNFSYDKNKIIEQAIFAFEGHLQTSYDLYTTTNDSSYLSLAFESLEKSRSLLLLENVQSNYTESYAGIPDSLVNRENEIEALLAYYEESIFENQSKKEKTEKSKLAEWQNKVFVLQQQKDSLVDLLKTQHPDYYDLKYNIQVSSLKNIQNNLPSDNAALLEYFVGDSAIYVFTITKDKYELQEIKKDFPLEDWVKKLRKSLYTYHLSGSRSEALYKTYADSLVITSNQLYQKLIAPILAQISLPEKLIIVPDGVLGYLPFELLIKEPPEDNTLFAAHQYLLKEHQISYNYSATLWQEMQHKKHDATSGNYLAFAPLFENNEPIASRSISEIRAGLGALLYNIPEIEAIEQQIDGKIFKGKDATKANFLKYASNFKILHLSTHGKANDKIGDYAYLAFAPNSDTSNYELLYNRDLYNMHLNADMVVLSACETGIGELQKGEGIISLARGFSYAGSKSIITTLWSVNDARTKELMESFYSYIKAGKTKDAALRQAKLDFITTHSHTAHPFFWAGFIGIGDMEPIDLNSNPPWWMWGLGALGLLTMIYFLRKKFFQSQNLPADRQI